jgi:eukaryotic-like serine/threonine-protein kinase
MPLPSGAILGEYEIVSPLGAGGMGEVYRARDARLDRDVAIKVLPESVSSNPERMRRFEQEARAAAALNHPNILAVYQMGRFEGGSYIVSELLEGETLRERINRGPISQRVAIGFALQIARGLAAAHRKGIVHRDLKPENLFLTKDGLVKILDFGLAKVMEPADTNETQAFAGRTRVGMRLGTAGYMSPEQVRGLPADPRSDIFSFSVILREMLTGAPTFQKPTSVETMAAILNEDPQPVEEKSASIPPGLDRVLHRGLEKDPDLRFHSASDLAFALEALSDPSIASQVSGYTPGRPAPKNRNRLRKVGAGLAVLVLAGVVLAAYLGLRPVSAPTVSNYVQLTHDGVQKSLIGTDGVRVYLNLTTTAVDSLAALDLAGGQETKIALPAADMQAIALSPDGSNFLVIEGKGYPFRGNLWSVPVLGGSPRRLGDAVGTAGAWSADGKQLAYADGSQLYLSTWDGTNARKIATASELIDSIVWSPDGTHLRLSESQGLGPAIGTHSLWEVASDGSGMRQLLAGWHRPPDECCGTWTPDGSVFLFQSGGQIWTLERGGGLLRRPAEAMPLTSSPMTLSSPLVSRDGKNLFVVGATYRGEMTEYDARTKQFVPFLGGISAEYVSISKDGQWAAWVAYPEGTLWRSKLDGSARMQLTSPPMHAVLPKWSPDGKTILFFTFATSATQPATIFTVPAEGGSVTELMPKHTTNQQDPGWSPDGSRIVFSGDQNDAAKAGSKPTIHFLDVASGQVSDLPGSTGMFSPRWSPDGKTIIAMNAYSRTLQLYSFATQKWTQLAEGTFGWVNFSADGQYVYALDFTGTGAVLRVHVPDGRIERVVDLKGFVTTGQWGGSLTLGPNDVPLLLRDRGTQDAYSLDWNER